MKKHIALLGLVGILAACNTMWGTIQKFDVLQGFSLTADKSDEVVTFQVGSQDVRLWSVKTFDKKKVMHVALVRTTDKKQFNFDQDQNDLKFNKTGSKDMTTPWEQVWRGCTYTETYTSCDGAGHCWSNTITRNGQELIRQRTAGTYDDYHVDVATKTGAALATLEVTMDNTKYESQIVSSCR